MKETNKPRPKAYSYLRFSTPEQSQGDSQRRQEALAVAYAKTHGLDLDPMSFKDLGVSAFRGDNARTGALREFRNAVELGAIPAGSYLLVESLDRLSRGDVMAAHGIFTSIISAGVTVVTLQRGAERTYSRESINANPVDLIVAILEMMRAHEESATKSRRLKAAWQGKRETLGTTNLTSVVPAWLKSREDRKGFDAIPERAEVVRRIFREYLSGVGMEAIAVGLNREGVPTFGRAKAWGRSYIAKILESTTVVGTFTPHTYERGDDGKRVRTPLDPVPNYYPAVVDLETFARAQAMQDQRTPARPREGGVKFTLAGLARCPLCGSTMTRINKGRKGGQPYLVCTKAKVGAGCTYHAVKLPNVHAALVHEASYIVGTAPTGKVEHDDRLEVIERELEGLDAAADHLLDAIARGGFSPLIQRRLDDIQQQREALREERESIGVSLLETSPTFVGKALEALEKALAAPSGEDLDHPKTNAALRYLVSGVVIDWRSGELVFQWKHGGTSRVTYAMPEQ